MLVAKKERIERLIASIDGILKGENQMDFVVFSKTKVEEMFQTMFEHMPDDMRNLAVKKFGNVEEWKKLYMKVVASEEVAERYNKRIEVILQKLIEKKDLNVNSFEVKEVVGEYGFVMKQLSQIKSEKELMLAQTQYYHNEKIRALTDEKYGKGASDFFHKQ